MARLNATHDAAEVVDRDRWSEAAAVAAVVVLGMVLRLAAMRPNILHVDEALFASFGRRIADHADLLLLNVGFELDRPPLFFWALGGTIAVLGDSAQTIRIPNLVFAGATIALAYFLARDLGGGRTGGMIAAVLVALSPFSILFGPTVFEEPGAVMLGMASLALVLARHPGWAGVALGLAVAVKLFAAALLPLAVGLAFAAPALRMQGAVRLVAAFAAVVAGLLAVMLLRTVVFGAPWFLEVQYQHVGGTRLLPPEVWPSRFGQWVHLVGFFAIGPAALLVALGVLFASIRSVLTRDWRPMLLVAFAVAYLALLTVAQFPIYDRYLYYALPPVMIAGGVGIGSALSRLPSATRPVLVSALAVVATIAIMWSGVASAIRLEYYVAAAGDRAFDGYERVCRWLIVHPAGDRVVWNQSLSWHFAYCLPGSELAASWYPDVDAIDAAGVGAYLAETRLDDPQVPSQLRARGWTVTLAQEFLASDGLPSIRIFRLNAP